MSDVQGGMQGNFIANAQQIENFLNHRHCYVGIPAERATRGDEGISNVELMYIHENGAPSKNIPARPAFQLGMQDAQDDILRDIIESIHAAINGDLATAEANLEFAGIHAENAIKQVFGDQGRLAPNSPYTIARKGSDAPLIDTGQLRASVTHVLRDD